MIKYLEVNLPVIKDEKIDLLYLELLQSKLSFIVISNNDNNYILTKEKSFFKVDDLDNFIDEANQDIYYNTIISSEQNYLIEDLELYKYYLNKYKSKMQKVYGDKYLFGSIAVRTTNNAFITTIRGKENLDEFTIVNYVDHINHIINVSNKKATLNAPLLDNIFKNKDVKAIIHINHEYDSSLPFYEYAFPGTVRDSFRDNSTSFNIKNHGLFLLFDKDKNILIKKGK